MTDMEEDKLDLTMSTHDKPDCKLMTVVMAVLVTVVMIDVEHIQHSTHRQAAGTLGVCGADWEPEIWFCSSPSVCLPTLL